MLRYFRANDRRACGADPALLGVSIDSYAKRRDGVGQIKLDRRLARLVGHQQRLPRKGLVKIARLLKLARRSPVSVLADRKAKLLHQLIRETLRVKPSRGHELAKLLRRDR